MLSSMVRHTLPDIHYNREIFTFVDGGQVGLDWTQDDEEGKDDDPGKPIVLILPGRENA